MKMTNKLSKYCSGLSLVCSRPKHIRLQLNCPGTAAFTSDKMNKGPPAFDPDAMINRISFWLKDCRTNHQQCAMSISGSPIDDSADASLPTRVLDLGQSDSLSCVRLLETNDRLGQYCALSHCWGPRDILPLRTIRSTLNNHIQGIEVSLLP